MVLAVLFAAPAAHAQIPSESDVRLAGQHAQKGRAHFDAGRYQRAVQEFQAAFKLEPDPQLQYSIGEAQRLNDADQPAIAAYRRYLELAPDGPDARNAHRHLRELGAERKTPRSRNGKAIATTTAPPKPTPPPEPPPPVVTAPEPPPPHVDLVAPPPARHPRAPLSQRNKWIIIGASAGAAVVIVLGVGLGVGLQPHETAFTEVHP